MSPDEPTAYDAATHYDRVTDAWNLLLGDELHYGVFSNGTETLREATQALTDRMVAAADVQPGTRVLDVGCGTGAPACHLGSLGATVVGITTSAIGVEQATARADAAGLGATVTFALRDGMDNGFPDQSFDRVWVLESSHLMRERDRLVAECARVLRNGGRLAVCDIVLRRPMPFDEVRRLRRPLALLREVFGDARMESLETYAALATGEGLRVDGLIDLTEQTRPTFDAWRQNADHHRDEILRSMSEEDLTRFIESCDVLEGFWDDGTLGYGLITASR